MHNGTTSWPENGYKYHNGDKIKKRLHLGNAYCFAVNKLLRSCLLARNVKIRKYKQSLH